MPAGAGLLPPLPLLQFLGVLLRLHCCSSTERQDLTRAYRGCCGERTTRSPPPERVQVFDNAAGILVGVAQASQCRLELFYQWFCLGLAMHLSNQSLLVILIVGIVAGWLAGRVMAGGGFGLIGDLIVGLIGAFIGDWLLPRLGIHLGTGIIALIINAFIGAVVLLLILRLVGGGWGGRRWGRRW